jgi:predicted NAD/FAD-binding protein
MGSGDATPRFVSPAEGRSWPILSPWNRRALLAYFRFALAAKRLTRNGDWSLPLDRWLRSLRVNEEEREQLLLPIVSATVGCSIEEARALSARSALVFIGLALPKNLLAPVLYRHSAFGLGGNVRFLAGISGNLTAHIGSPVTTVQRIPEGGFAIENALGVRETVDVLVLATPPYVSRDLLRELPGHRRAISVLDRFEYFPAEIAIHRDPVYMPEDPRFWSAYNALVDGAFSEASIWYGALHPQEAGEAPLPLFKSWATARARAPEQEIVRRAFRHPLVTPDFLAAGRRLARLQGQDGVWFIGSYTREVDGQDTALLSAMSVVRELDPQAPNLLALESTLGP